MVYLDFAAATPVDAGVLAAAQPYWNEQFYNPSALYQPARDVKAALQAARSEIAGWIGCQAEEVYFTAGGTEANNLAIKGVMEQYPDKRCVISALEHESVRAPAAHYDLATIPVGQDGLIDPESLTQLVDDQTVLVSIIYASNEIGTIQPLREIGRVLERLRKQRRAAGNDLPLYFHTDACQAANYLDLHQNNLGVDLLTINGGKLYGFKQSGCLYVRRGLALQPLIDGGGQEFALRSGTENVAFAVGLAAALTQAQQLRHDEQHRLEQLQKHFINQLQQTFPDCIMNGTQRKRLVNNVHVTFPGQHNEVLLLQLEQQGVLAAAGSACSANDQAKPSYVLEAIGLDTAAIQASIRFSLGRTTTEQDISHCLDVLRSILLSKKQ